MRKVSRAISAGFGALLCCGVLVACGSSETQVVPALGIELIEPAIAAVRQAQGVEPAFFEINSTVDGVNLFIAASRLGDARNPDAVIQGRYTSDGGLVLAEELLDASGPIFTAANLDLSAERLVGQVVGELENAKPLMFVLSAAKVVNPIEGGDSSGGVTSGSDIDESLADQEVVRRVIMESERGGRLAVFVDGDGNILGTEVLEGSG
jgi:hypothetical protein